MFSKNLFLQPVRGFIAFAPGGSHPLSPPVARPKAADAPAVDDGSAWGGWAGRIDTRRTWQSPAGRSVRQVEIAILASVCSYFAFGLGSALGLY